jgi:hypothetical protein
MKNENWFRNQAKEMHHKEVDLEIDDDAPVSSWDPRNGAYVQAWVWVSAAETRKVTVQVVCGSALAL